MGEEEIDMPRRTTRKPRAKATAPDSVFETEAVDVEEPEIDTIAAKPKPPAQAPAAVVSNKPVPFIALRTVKVTPHIAAANGLTSPFVVPDQEVVMTRPEASKWIESGSFESLAQRDARKDAASFDKGYGG